MEPVGRTSAPPCRSGDPSYRSPARRSSAGSVARERVKNTGSTAEVLDRMDAMEAAVATQSTYQPADDPKVRDAQRARLRKLHDELVAEGADDSKHLPELQRRADTWPE